MGNQSEVARLKAAIQAQYGACNQGLRGLALGTAQHQMITARMERISNMVSELRATHGEEVAMQVMIALGDMPEGGQSNATI